MDLSGPESSRIQLLHPGWAIPGQQSGQVVDSSGALLQGYQADSAGNITSIVSGITLTSSAVPPVASSTAAILGNLNANATVPATAFAVTDTTSYNFSTGMTFYDSLGNSHQMQLYFRKTAANAWGVYSQIDGGAATAQTNMTFNASGAVTAGGTQTVSAALTNGATTPQTLTVNLASLTIIGAASGCRESNTERVRLRNHGI